MKNPQTQAAEPSNKEQKEIIIEDCQVPVDNTSYGDWLLEQGINTNVDLQNRSNADNMEITQITKQKKDIATKGNVEQAGSVVPIPNSTDDKGLFDANMMVQEYVAKFQADLNTYIISSQSEEDTMDRINRVSDALRNMGADPSILALSLKNTEETQDIHKENADEPNLQDNKDGNNNYKPLQSEIDNPSVEPDKENTEDKMKEEEQKLNENNSDDQKPPTICKTTEDNTEPNLDGQQDKKEKKVKFQIVIDDMPKKGFVEKIKIKPDDMKKDEIDGGQ